MKLTIDEDRILAAVGATDTGGLSVMATFIEAAEWRCAEDCIYALATVHHETEGAFAPYCELGEPEDFAEHEPMTPVGSLYGNRFEGDGYLFRRRGYMPIVGRYAYSKFGSVLDLPLTTDPDMVLDAGTAFRILKEGMERGLFTGRAIKDFINAQYANYVAARRAFNRLDKANLIARYADQIEDAKGVAIAEEH